MKGVAVLALIGAGLSIILGLVSKMTLTPLKIVPGGVESVALLSIADTCLLAAIALLMLVLVNKK